MQHVDAREPVRIAPEDAAARAHRRDAWHIAAIGEGRAHHIGLAFDTEHAGAELGHIDLGLEFTAAEGGVPLRIDRLVELLTRTDDAGATGAGIAGESAIDEAVELRVVTREFEAHGPRGATQTDFDRLRRLDAEIGIADIEGASGIVAAA